MLNIDVCLSPQLIHLYKIEDKIVVIADILRATSCIVTAFAHGAAHILPMDSAEECKKMKQQGYIISGEYNGSKIAGFDKGNSPFEYMDNSTKKSKIAFKTTNGTIAIQKSKKAKQLLIGSFLNLAAITHYLAAQDLDILVICSGWKGKINIEDSLFAGALVDALKEKATPNCDAPILAQQLYLSSNKNLLQSLDTSSHICRLRKLNLYKDIKFCITLNQYNVIPMLKNGYLTL